MIREAVADDAARLAEFAERCFRGAFENDIRPAEMARYLPSAFGETIQRTEIIDPGTVMLLAQAGHDLAGYAHVRRQSAPEHIPSASPIELKRFYVATEWHGRGLAQQLMNSVIGVAEKLDGDLVWLGVWEWNARAISFYSKSHFVDAGSHPFLLGDEEQTDRIMIRRLAR